jgi:xylan 1,4-beta-xylosidase
VTGSPQRVLLRHYRIDETHSNAYTLWQQIGAPQSPNTDQYKQLESAGQLQLLESPKWVSLQSGELKLEFMLPANSVSLVELSW